MYRVQYEISSDKGWPYDVTVAGTTMAEALEAFHRYCEGRPHMGVRVRITDIQEII